ncbi:glycosyltransferase [Niabella aurantiaca]|uniref:glycosyltransferase n=1 Tax=Niabella aurantiaca TaxID=379900 RepID=UPI00068568B4|nr:glycosyltransferase [Niabella aurantiaca]
MKPKTLIIYNKIWPYREKIFELLNEQLDLTVGFNDPAYVGKKFKFKTIYLPTTNVGPFVFHKNNLRRLSSKYDAIIGLFDIHWISLMTLSLLPKRNYSVSFWGIGVRASYENKFDSTSRWDKLRFFFAKSANSVIFYSSYPLTKYINGGISKEKLFVANNTTEVAIRDTDNMENKKNFLFVGTLYPQKGIEILLEAYSILFKKYQTLPGLNIIGDGPELSKIKKYIEMNGLSNAVTLHGSIYDRNRIAQYYDESIACISPNQAGLSVLNSMGNATIFLTSKDAITGGEIFNISDKETGLFFDGTVNSLVEKMEWIFLNKEKALEICQNAKVFYLENRLPQMMAQSIVDAVFFALRKNKSHIAN